MSGINDCCLPGQTSLSETQGGSNLILSCAGYASFNVDDAVNQVIKGQVLYFTTARKLTTDSGEVAGVAAYSFDNTNNDVESVKIITEGVLNRAMVYLGTGQALLSNEVAMKLDAISIHTQDVA